MQTITEFLELFYNTISFEHGDDFKSAAFRELFYPFAVLVENVNGKYKNKTIEEHIKEFEHVIKEYPELFIKGFHEVQIHYEVIQNDNYFLVSSTYKKTYSREEQDIVENGKFKIASIAW